MIAYTYNPITMEFVGDSSVDESPLEPGVWLMPAYSTEIPAPEFNPETHICYFNKEKNSWIIQDVDTEPEIERISEEDIAELKEELKEALEEKSKILLKLGLTTDEIELLLVKLPPESVIDNLLGQPVPESGLPSLKKPADDK
jgi:hypothetical protein